MKSGYRLKAATAYANYYSDVRNMAEFGRMQGARDAVGNAVGAVTRPLFAGGRRASRAIQSGARQVDEAIMGGAQGAMNKAGMMGPQTARRKRMLGYGGAAAAGAGVGAAGYGGYKLATRPDEEEQY